MSMKLTLENKIADIPELNRFRIGDHVIVDASADNDRFDGVIIGIEFRRVYGSDRLEPSITLLHDGYITDEFKPIDCRKVDAPPQSNVTGYPIEDENYEPEWEGHELVEAVIGLQERVLRNLCIATTSDQKERQWHVVEAEEAYQNYLVAFQTLRAWLASKGVSIPGNTPSPETNVDVDTRAAVALGAAVLTRIEDPAVRETAIRNALTMASLNPSPQSNTDGTSEIFEAMWKNHRDELLARVAELEAQLASPGTAPENHVSVPQSAIDWLFGEGPDANGEWFERPEGAHSFWWRSHFRKLIFNVTQSPSPPEKGTP